MIASFISLITVGYSVAGFILLGGRDFGFIRLGIVLVFGFIHLGIVLVFGFRLRSGLLLVGLTFTDALSLFAGIGSTAVIAEYGHVILLLTRPCSHFFPLYAPISNLQGYKYLDWSFLVTLPAPTTP